MNTGGFLPFREDRPTYHQRKTSGNGARGVKVFEHPSAGKLTVGATASFELEPALGWIRNAGYEGAFRFFDHTGSRGVVPFAGEARRKKAA